jgi:allene oxide cyclase
MNDRKTTKETLKMKAVRHPLAITALMSALMLSVPALSVSASADEPGAVTRGPAAAPGQQGMQGSGGGEGSSGRGGSLSVVERAITDIPLDIGAQGASLGDLLTFVNEIYDEADTTQIGEDRGACTLVDVGISYYCSFMVLLEEGNIALAGPFFIDGRPSTFAITGGTGAYGDARGEAAFTFRDSEAGFPKYNVVFEFN